MRMITIRKLIVKLLILICILESLNSESKDCLWNDEKIIPKIGAGTTMKGYEAYRNFQLYLDVGYRFFDSAEATEWYSDDILGEVVNNFINENNNIQRQDLILASKVHPKNLGYENTKKSVENMLQNYNTEYMDIVLLHFSHCWLDGCENLRIEGTWKDSWRALEELKRSNKIRMIGVSNFSIKELNDLLNNVVESKIDIIQDRSDPFKQNRANIEFAHNNDILFTAYSSLGSQWYYNPSVRKNLVFESPTLNNIATEINATSIAEVVLSYQIRRNIIVIPSARSEKHMKLNIELLNPNHRFLINELVLTEHHLNQIDQLDGVFNADDRCEEWAKQLECEKNSGYMLSNCKAACLGLPW